MQLSDRRSFTPALKISKHIEQQICRSKHLDQHLEGAMQHQHNTTQHSNTMWTTFCLHMQLRSVSVHQCKKQPVFQQHKNSSAVFTARSHSFYLTDEFSRRVLRKLHLITSKFISPEEHWDMNGRWQLKSCQGANVHTSLSHIATYITPCHIFARHTMAEK